ncbi:MAG: HupE/UreJ family protein [Rhodospirillales bacterium]|nr:HupE/UreJ family protein [Rhodospirillales bacterium]
MVFARRPARRGNAVVRLILFWLVGIAFPLIATPPAFGHELSMAVLSLKEFRPGVFIGRWTLTSGLDEQGLSPVFPSHCTWVAPRLDCGERGLNGTLGFEGMGSKQSAVMFRVTLLDKSTRTYTLTPASPTLTVTQDPGHNFTGWREIADTYITLGIDHILLGVDHLLFVLGLIWLVRSTRMLIKTISAFTVAHSLTLAAATFGWIVVPERAVNAAIALSIVFVGVEIVKLQGGQVGLTARHPWAVAFSFGLLHGLGFASALSTLGIPQATLPFALLFFNLGVEIGQIAFVLLVLAVMWAHRTVQAQAPRWCAPVPAYAIGAVASFWFLTRMGKIFIT